MYADLQIGRLHGDVYMRNLLREPGNRFGLCDFGGTGVAATGQ